MSEAQVIEKYADFVDRLAGKLIGTLKVRIERDDLIAYGRMGLLQAWRRYDPSSAAAFTSFAYYRIRGAMLDGCRKEGWASRERKATVRQMSAVNEHQASEQQAQQGRPASRSLSEAAERVGKRVGNALTIVMLEESDFEGPMVEQPADQEQRAARRRMNARLGDALSALSDEERVLVTRHHYYGESLTDIGREIGKSTSWCSRMHARAIEKMRVSLEKVGVDSASLT